MPELESISAINESSSIENINQQYHPGWEGVKLLLGVENAHKKNLLSLDSQQQDISFTLGEIKDHLKRCEKHVKSDAKSADLNMHKENILKLWNDWREELKTKNSKELNDMSRQLENLDFKNISLDDIDNIVIPELEKVRRHHEHKYGQIPNQLRLFIELFTITVEILKDVPKKFQEVNSHISRNTTKG